MKASSFGGRNTSAAMTGVAMEAKVGDKKEKSWYGGQCSKVKRKSFGMRRKSCCGRNEVEKICYGEKKIEKN